jgi:hemoglobin/transferrin/lactoferrin receptor protein
MSKTDAQEKKDSAFVELDEVVVSFNKWEQSRNEIPNRIEKINRTDVRLRNPQTTADLLGQMGGVFIQKSQLSGGSPMIRGFATNRVLIVNDGVRMNNAIYRSGNLQNIISIDPFTIENGEVVFGPGSLIYGSDAIGGVMDFRSVTPKFSTNGKLNVGGTTALQFC